MKHEIFLFYMIIYCPTEDITADTLTEHLPSIKKIHFAAALGLHST